MDLKSVIRTIPDYPKPGILFRDVTTLMGHGEAFQLALSEMAAKVQGMGITKVAGIEARGFVFGAALADRLGTGFVPVRKPGKLPADTIGVDYELEYGTDRLELHIDAVGSEDRVLIVDDLLATGGTALAAAALLARTPATVLSSAFVVELPDLGGRQRLEAAGTPVISLISFEGH